MELEALTPADAGKRMPDGGGLVGVASVDRSGRVIVPFKYRFRSPVTNRVRDTACGIWPKESLKKIRANRDALRVAVGNGIDPIETSRTDKVVKKAADEEKKAAAHARLDELAASKARLTVRDLFDRWEKAELAERKDKGAEVRRMFEKDVLPKLGDLAAEDVRKGHVMAVVDKIKERGVARMPRVVFSLIRQMMRYAVDRDLIDSDPTSAIRKAKAVGTDSERNRTLSEAEIRELAVKLPTSGLSEPAQAAVWLMLSTLARVGELSKAKWQDVDLDSGVWRIPPEVAKNGEAHTIYLSPFAVAQFERLKDQSLVWVLPSRDGGKHLDEKTITKQVRDRQRGDRPPMKGRAGSRVGRVRKVKPATIDPNVLILKGGDWTSHDLRRTGATLMGELGTAGDVIEKCLNHKEENKIRRTYQRQRNEAEMREAWRLLGERLELLTSDADNVVTLQRSA